MWVCSAGYVLQHCPGQVDEYLEQFVMLAVRRLQMPSCESKNLKCLLVTVVANALFYNAALCLQVRCALCGSYARHDPRRSQG